MIFENRYQAGEQLAHLLVKYLNHPDTILLGLARGGVVTAAAVAEKLNLPLEVLCPRKIGAPSNQEFAIGAVSAEGDPLLNEDLIAYLHVSQEYLKESIERERKTALLRLKKFRQGRKCVSLENKIVILVDDGLATGSTMCAAIKEMQTHHVKRIIVAVPVASADTLKKIQDQGIEVVCVMIPKHFAAVGQFYKDFEQTEDDEVIALIQHHRPS